MMQGQFFFFFKFLRFLLSSLIASPIYTPTAPTPEELQKEGKRGENSGGKNRPCLSHQCPELRVLGEGELGNAANG